MVGLPQRPLRVFLCHASVDKPAVRVLYKFLIAEGIDVWLDEEKILPGQNWEEEIQRAVQIADVAVICLSKNSTTKEGYIQKEIKFALDIADEKPDNTIYIIPLKFEECEVPKRLRIWQWIDFSVKPGVGYREYNKLLKSLQVRAQSINAYVPGNHKKLLKDTMQYWADHNILPSKRILELMAANDLSYLTVQDLTKEEMAFLYCIYHLTVVRKSDTEFSGNVFFDFDSLLTELSKHAESSSPYFGSFKIIWCVGFETIISTDKSSNILSAEFTVVASGTDGYYILITTEDNKFTELLLLRRDDFKTSIRHGAWNSETDKENFLSTLMQELNRHRLPLAV